MEWYTHECGLDFLIMRGRPTEVRTVRFMMARKLTGSWDLRTCPRCDGELPGPWNMDPATGIHTILLSDGSHN